MNSIAYLTHQLGRLNAALLTVGLWLGAGALGIMLVFMLMQVFFRYFLGNALAWSEEGSRFLMLWMTGLMVPTAFRQPDDGAAVRAWATDLLRRWDGRREGARERRVLAAYMRGRLARLARHGVPAALPSRPVLLFAGWRAARGD